MHLSVLLTSLPMPFAAALHQARELGFRYVDVVAETDRPADQLDALADSGLLVWSAALGKNLPPDWALDAPGTAVRRDTLDAMKRQIDDAALLGARQCYVVAGRDGSPAGLARFRDGVCLLADHAAGRMVPVCVEPIPGRALATAAQTLAWLDRVAHDHLLLLLDSGHCLISDEDPAQVAFQAGARLGHVHLDDNDSVEDLHWPLLTGRLTADMLEALLTMLTLGDYQGAVTLEFSPALADPARALRDGAALVRQLATIA
jgi:sugar phosphate isomerase/epimerase